MAITNKICAKMCNCKSITVTDISDWDTLNTADITSSVYSLYDKDDELVETKSFLTYTSSVTFSKTENFEDGEYKIIVTFTDNTTTEHTIEEYFYNTCNIKCKIEQLIKDFAFDEDCDDCKKEAIALAAEAYILYQGLIFATICKNTIEADKLLAWLEEKLINYKCKSC